MVTRYHARWVIPVCASPIRNGTVVVDGDRIAWVGPRASAPSADAIADDDLGDAVLLPGLVNTHTHLDLAMFAGALSGRSFFPWVRMLVRGLAEATDETALADAAVWSVGDQLAHGVTTIGHTGPGRAPFDALRAMGARGIAYFETFGPDSAQAPASISDLRARVNAARRDESPLVRAGVSPHAPYSVSDELYRLVARYAKEDALPVAVHIAESAAESQLVAEGSGEFAEFLRGRDIGVLPRATSPIALLDRTGLLSVRPLCIHAVQIDGDDMRRLAAAGATVAHCPRANAWFGYGTSPVHALRTFGVRVGLGTDSIASNQAVRMLGEARDAADDSLSPAMRLEMATRGGAMALGMESEIGVLAPGTQADLAAFAIGDLNACDAGPERYLLEHCVESPALRTVVAGAVRARDGRALNADDALVARMAAHCARVQLWAGERSGPAPRLKA